LSVGKLDALYYWVYVDILDLRMRTVHRCLFLSTGLNSIGVRVEMCDVGVERVVADGFVVADQDGLEVEWDQRWELIILELVDRCLVIDRSYGVPVGLLVWAFAVEVYVD
jgi:hypothetical protein